MLLPKELVGHSSASTRYSVERLITDRGNDAQPSTRSVHFFMDVQFRESPTFVPVRYRGGYSPLMYCLRSLPLRGYICGGAHRPQGTVCVGPAVQSLLHGLRIEGI